MNLPRLAVEAACCNETLSPNLPTPNPSADRYLASAFASAPHERLTRDVSGTIVAATFRLGTGSWRFSLTPQFGSKSNETRHGPTSGPPRCGRAGRTRGALRVVAVDLQHVEPGDFVGIVFGLHDNRAGVRDAERPRRAVVVADHLGDPPRTTPAVGIGRA